MIRRCLYIPQNIHLPIHSIIFRIRLFRTPFRLPVAINLLRCVSELSSEYNFLHLLFNSFPVDIVVYQDFSKDMELLICIYA